jgi:spoIIIJ-associated protein
MQKSVIIKARTVEEAIESALKELNATIDQVDTKILEIPSSGLIGKIGKQAKVEVTLLEETPVDIAVSFLQQLTANMNVPATVTANQREDGVLSIEMSGENMRLLIGRRGVTLDAMQYLVSLAVNKHSEEYVKIILDTEGYREKREKALKEFADKMASRVVRSGRRVELEPMNPYERRIIHASLQNHRKVQTKSQGEEPYRRVIIELK